MKEFLKKCQVCAKEFKTKRKHQKTCGMACMEFSTTEYYLEYKKIFKKFMKAHNPKIGKYRRLKRITLKHIGEICKTMN